MCNVHKYSGNLISTSSHFLSKKTNRSSIYVALVMKDTNQRYSNDPTSDGSYPCCHLMIRLLCVGGTVHCTFLVAMTEWNI